jgi:hypothetical protein
VIVPHTAVTASGNPMVHDLRCIASLDTVAGHRITGPLIADRLFNSVGYACIMDGRQPDAET